MKKKELETYSFNCTSESKNGRYFLDLNDDVMDEIIEFESINNLLDTCKELHKLKKKFLFIELDEEKTVKFFKEDKYRDYIYSLVDNPRKQLTLNIVQDFVPYAKGDRSIDFIFNETEDFNPEYLKILNSVYKYKFSYLSLNRDVSTRFMFTNDKFNKKYLNFTSLDVNLLIESLIVNNVKYDIEHLLKNKNIKILSMCQTPDTLCFDDSEQYNLHQKLKNYSKKYSICFEPVHNNDLVKILNKFATNTSELIFSYIPLCNTIPKIPYRDGGSWRRLRNMPVEDNSLRSLLKGFDYMNFKNEDELPTLTESYIKQMNDEYYRDKKNKKKRKKKNNK